MLIVAVNTVTQQYELHQLPQLLATFIFLRDIPIIMFTGISQTCQLCTIIQFS